MDSADKFVNNPAPRKLLAALVIILIISAATGWFIAGKCADVVVGTQIEAMLGAAGKAADEANFSFTKPPSEQDVAAGEEIFSRYGISRDMEPRLMSGWNDIRNMFFIVIFGSCTLLSAVWFALSLRRLFMLYDRLEQLRACCVKISEMAEFSLPVSPESFSCTSRLSESIKLIADRMDYLMGTLRSEKNFLRDFLSDFSHQMKTSLAVIRLSSDMLSEIEGLSAEKIQQLYCDISEHVSGMEALIISALKLAKLNAGAIEYNMEPAKLSQTCQTAINRIAPLLREKGISAEFHAQSDVITAHDKVWLCEALENIIKNSADHSDCTKITVELSSNPIAVTVAVSDNGKGIPQEEIPRIFERFGKKSNNNSMSSAGIGMPIAKKIAMAHNGDILIFSAPKKGTRVEMVFLK